MFHLPIANCLAFAMVILVQVTSGKIIREGPGRDCNFGGLRCPNNQTCITYERDCGRGAVCTSEEWGLKSFQCADEFQNSGIPKLHLCQANELFVRGFLSTCQTEPCNYIWTYKCYSPLGIMDDKCETIICPHSSQCVYEERCRWEFCRPMPVCIPKLP